MESSETPGADAPDERPRKPAAGQLAYVLSLPERALRTGTGLLGGVVRESAALLVPRSFQNSRTYTMMVRQMLDFLIHDVGRVAAEGEPSSTANVDNYVARKAVGNFVDMASLATLHVSPLLILAVVSDVAYGSSVYLKELADELKEQGVIDERAAIHHVNDLLSAVSDASAVTSKAFNTPPLSVEALRATIDETRAAIGSAKISQALPQAEVGRLWDEMRDVARRDGVSLLAVSGAMSMRMLDKVSTLSRGALSTVKVAGVLVDQVIIDHYTQALGDIRDKGVYASIAETSEPYIAAVWENFQPSESTLTEDLISGKALGGAWRAARRWLGGEAKPPDASTDSPATETPEKSQPQG
jgi:hypothetical protein